MYFSGSQATNLEETALDVLKSALEAGLSQAPHAATFARYGGVKVTAKVEDGLNHYQSKRPFIFLELVSDEPHDWKKVVGQTRQGARHELEISLELVTVPSCAIIEKPFKDAVVSIVKFAYATLRDAGLYKSKIRAGRASDLKDRRNPHVFTCEAYALAINP